MKIHSKLLCFCLAK